MKNLSKIIFLDTVVFAFCPKMCSMFYNTYRSLPIDALYDLLTISVIDLLEALEENPVNKSAIKELKAQIQIIIGLIGEKKSQQSLA